MSLRGARARLLVGLLACVLSLTVLSLGWLERVELATWDWRVGVIGRPSPASPSIVLVLVDQDSLDWGRERGFSWPWPREIYAAVVAFAERGGARSVVFDILFTEPSPYAQDDDRLAEALDGGVPTVIAMMLGKTSGAARKLPESALSLLPSVAGEVSGEPAAGATLPVDELLEAATLVADVAASPDPDGILRRQKLLRSFDQRAVPSLGLAAFLASRPDLEIRVSPGSLELGSKVIPLDGEGKMIVPYRGRDAYEQLKAAAIVESELRLRAGEDPLLDPSALKDRYVIVGYSAPGLLDLRSTPVDRKTPGAQVHAAVLDALITGDGKKDVPLLAFALLLLFLCSIPALDRFIVSASMKIAFWLFLLALPPAVALLAYEIGWWWPLVPTELGVMLVMFGSITLAYFTEGRQKRFIKNVFRHYLSPAVIEQLIADPSRLRLGGERRELTIFFSDLAGFSGISEKLEPEALTTLLNRYLTDMTDIILEEGGTLDKYEGDAIIAFWNAPVPQADHAARACRTAIRCQRRLAEIRPELAATAAGMELHMRIGMHTGDVVVGNMGSKERFDYTILGDAANLAARLEGANKAFGTETMISEPTRQAAGAGFLARELGDLRVVGRRRAVKVHELFGFGGEAAPPEHAVFAEGLSLLRKGDWPAARQRFDALQGDQAALRYIEDGFDGWDGVISLQNK